MNPTEHLQAFLAAFGTGDPARFAAFIADHYKENAPAAVERWTNWWRLFYHDTRGLNLHRIESANETAVSALTRPNLYDGWVTIRIMVDPEPPHAITGMMPGFVRRPADLSPGRPIADGDLAAAITPHIESLVARDVFSGSVLVARHGEVLFQGAWGLAHRGHAVPNRLETRFNLGSMNKMFTAVATLQLVQAGKLGLQDTVAQHLPTYPNPAAGQITIHHLLSHTSGMGNIFGERYEQSLAKLRTVADYLPLFQDDALLFAPGARWQYSNAGFTLLGAIIEAASGQSYFDYVREHIYVPAGMNDTDCYEVDADVANLAVGYMHWDPRGNHVGDRFWSNVFKHVARGGPAGGGYATAPDLLRFDRALRSHLLLDPEHTDLLLTGKATVDGGLKYAYGFFEDTAETRVVGHGGGFSGINSVLDMYMETGHTVIVMANYDPPAASRVSDRIRELITQGI